MFKACENRLSSHNCPLLKPSVCRSAPPCVILDQPIPCLSRRPVRRAVVLALAGLLAPPGTSCKGFSLSAVFWRLTHDTGESSPDLGPGISRLTLVTGLTLTSPSTLPRPSLQQVLAGLLSIDLTSEWPVQGKQTTPTAFTHASTKASRALLSPDTSSSRRRTASKAVSLLTDCIVCRRGCVTASGGG